MNETQKKEVVNFLRNDSIGNEAGIMEDVFSNVLNESELKSIALDLWNQSSDDHVDLQHIIVSIHSKIKTQHNHGILHGVWRCFYRAAAILLIPLLSIVGLLWNDNQQQAATFTELTSPKSSRIQFVLPDGTTGFLNGGSTLRYNCDFKRHRKLTLNGECYFNVAKNKKNPFVVKTNYADIKVTGTHFDICAYNGDNEIVTTLEEGSVIVQNKLNKTKHVLKPGEQSRIDLKTGNMKVTKVNTDLYTSWTLNMLKFDNAPFSDVIKKVERWYGVRILLDDNLLKNENYTMIIKTESLREMLQLLAITTPMNCKIDNDIVFITKPK